jgi:hypothetical protein
MKPKDLVDRHNLAHVPIRALEVRYKLGNLAVRQVLDFDTLERARLTRTRRPENLTDTQVDEVIRYISESWGNCILK